jgi:hypothetical protein
MSRTDRKGRSPRRGARQLRIERLEDRSVPAVAAFTIELREDDGGNPGQTLAADEISAGDSFFVEILAQEFHPLFAGLHGVALDVAWDPQALEEIDSPFNPNSLVSEHLPLFRRGTLDSEAGTIDNLSGATFQASGTGRPIGDLAAERFAILHFRAIGDPAETAINLIEGRSRIVTAPATTFSSAQLSFERQAIEIVPASQAAGPVGSHPALQALPAPTELLLGESVDPQVAVLPPAIATPADLPDFNTDPPLAATPPPESHANPGCQASAPAASPVVASEIHLAAVEADLLNDEFAAAVDLAFVGPLSLEQTGHFYATLEEIIAAIAADMHLNRTRRAHSSVVQPPFHG